MDGAGGGQTTPRARSPSPFRSPTGATGADVRTGTTGGNSSSWYLKEDMPKIPIWDMSQSSVPALEEQLLLYTDAHPPGARHIVANKMIDKYPIGHDLRTIGMTLLREGKLKGEDAGTILVETWVATLLGRNEGELARILKS